MSDDTLPTNYRSRLPIGVPTHYTMERTHISCGHCGNTQTTCRLLASFKQQNGGLTQRPMGASEQLYARLPLEYLDRNGGTPRCERCVNSPRDLPLELLQPIGTQVNWLRDPKVETVGAPRKTEKKHATLDELEL